ncbi:MAG: flagellar hook-length control protein FliK [Myxococcales bacterium]|nr:flagellar hook-length control protein FliK [Myxococcales bacterium]
MKIVSTPLEELRALQRSLRLPRIEETTPVPVGVALLRTDSPTPTFLRALEQAEAGREHGWEGERWPLDTGRRSGATANGVTATAEAAQPDGQVDLSSGTVVTFVEASHPAGLTAPPGTGIAGAQAAIVAHVVGAHVMAAGRAGGTPGDMSRRGTSSPPPVVVQLRGHRDGGTQADLVLRHPEFGRIDIAIGVEGARVSLSVSAGTRLGRAALAEAKPELGRLLAASGFELVECNVAAGHRGPVAEGGGPRRHLDLEV